MIGVVVTLSPELPFDRDAVVKVAEGAVPSSRGCGASARRRSPSMRMDRAPQHLPLG